MISRCHNPNHESFEHYGARGITVCDRWRQSFEAFLSDVGRRPHPKLSIDRIENNRGYEPGNVRWATRSQQNSNKRSLPRENKRLLKIDGVTKPMKEWLSEVGLSETGFRDRIRRGYSEADAIRLPRMKRNGQPR